MTRLEVLKAEKEQIKGLRCLSFGLIDKCIEWYDKEIEAIVIHGADNKFYGQQVDGDLISRQSLYNKIAEMEEFSKLDLLETKPQVNGKININYAWYLAKLMDRTRFLKMIADEPSVKGE